MAPTEAAATPAPAPAIEAATALPAPVQTEKDADESLPSTEPAVTAVGAGDDASLGDSDAVASPDAASAGSPPTSPRPHAHPALTEDNTQAQAQSQSQSVPPLTLSAVPNRMGDGSIDGGALSPAPSPPVYARDGSSRLRSLARDGTFTDDEEETDGDSEGGTSDSNDAGADEQPSQAPAPSTDALADGGASVAATTGLIGRIWRWGKRKVDQAVPSSATTGNAGVGAPAAATGTAAGAAVAASAAGHSDQAVAGDVRIGSLAGAADVVPITTNPMANARAATAATKPTPAPRTTARRSTVANIGARSTARAGAAAAIKRRGAKGKPIVGGSMMDAKLISNLRSQVEMYKRETATLKEQITRTTEAQDQMIAKVGC